MATDVRSHAFESRVTPEGAAAHDRTIERYRDFVTTSFERAAMIPLRDG